MGSNGTAAWSAMTAEVTAAVSINKLRFIIGFS
jgi:hypothetical protein